MGLKDLCERLGADYLVVVSPYNPRISISIYTNKQPIWTYRESLTDSLSGLFKETYGDIVNDIIPGSVFSVDKNKKP